MFGAEQPMRGYFRLWCGVVPVALAVICVNWPPAEAEAFCNQDTPFGVAECPGNTGGHKDITQSALGFLRTEIFKDIVDEHIFVDTTGFFDPEKHFDNSQFTQSADRINSQYTASGGVVDELAPTSLDPFGATDEYGQLLHTVQDFYSHTNWVDIDPTKVPLIDAGLGKWAVPTPYGNVTRGTKSMIVVQGLTSPAPITPFTIKKTRNGTQPSGGREQGSSWGACENRRRARERLV